MSLEPKVNQCPRCGGVVPSDAPEGLCPRCILAGAATPTDAGRALSEGIVPPPIETVAKSFPDLEIVELIGVGGMGIVYKVRQPKLDRYAALKLLPQSLSADPAFAERFHREARFLARLNHPNIVTVFDFGQAGGFCYLLLEFVDGVNLRQAMRAGRFSPAEALAIIPYICAALQYAHDQGVLHRDIKPANILLDNRGRVKLVDFGIAKLVNEPGGSRGDITLTQSGARLGTAHYMAPEQIEKPSEVDHRADIYSLGVVFYELLTGELPIGRFAPPSEKAEMDSRVDAIVFRALAKERELRQQSAGEVRTQVETVTSQTQAAKAAPGSTSGPAQPPVGPRQAGGRVLGSPTATSWPRRFKWLGIASLVLLVTAFLNFILIRWFNRLGILVPGVFSGMLPILAGAWLGWAYIKGRPQPSSEPSDGTNGTGLFKILFATILGILTVIALCLFIIIASRIVLPPPKMPPASIVTGGLTVNETVRLFQTDLALGDPVSRINWELESPIPGSIRLSVGHRQILYPLRPGPGQGRWHIPINLLFERSRAGMMVSIIAGGTPFGNNLRVAVPGDSAQLLKKAGELLTGDLSLNFNTPVWIAFAGLEQVRLEVIRDIVPEPPDALPAIDYGGLPEALPAGSSNIAALKWHAAWEKRELLQKRAELGEIAPQGKEMFEAERDMTAAESEFVNDPSIAAAADLEYANRILEIAKNRYEVGAATKAEYTAAIRAQQIAEAAFEKYQPQISEGSPTRP